MGSCCSKQAIDQDSSISNSKQSININQDQSNSKQSININQDQSNPKQSKNVNQDQSNHKQSININLIKPNLTLNKQIPDEKEQSIKFHTNIEVDMHGKLDDPYEWIIYVRQTLQSAYNKKVDKVTFIPGKGSRHHQENGTTYRKPPFLPPLVILTTKLCGFHCHFDPQNKGKIICSISSKRDLTPELNPKFKLTKNDTKLIKQFYKNPAIFNELEKYSNDEIIISYNFLRQNFPNKPYLWYIIIAVTRTKKNSCKNYANTFLSYFERPLQSDFNNKNNAKEMTLVQKLNDEYNFDTDFIEHVARDNNYNENKCRKIFERVNEIPDHIYSSFLDYVEDHSELSVQSLLNLYERCNYNEDAVNKRIISDSSKEYKKITKVLDTHNAVNSLREMTDCHLRLYGELYMPKVVPSITINLSRAGYHKAIRHIERVMDIINTQKFGQFELKFNENENSIFCKKEEINKYVLDKAKNDDIKLIVNKNCNESDLCFFISNIVINEEKHDAKDNIDEENSYNDDDYDDDDSGDEDK